MGSVGLLIAVLIGTGTVTSRRAAREASVEPLALSLAIGSFGAPAEDPEAVAFGQRFGPELATRLGQHTNSVRIVALPALREVKPDGDRRQLALQAGARYLAEGNAHRSGDSYVLSVRLIDATDGRQSWSGTFELPSASGTQAAKIASRNVERELAMHVLVAETNRTLKLPVDRLNAAELLVRAYAVAGRPSSLANAKEMRGLVDSSLRLDPNYVLGLGMAVWAVDYLNDVDPEPDHDRYVREVDEFSAREVALDPDGCEAWRDRALALLLLGQWNASHQASERSIALDPFSYARYAHRAFLMNLMGRPAEALALSEKSLSMAPSDYPYLPLRMACMAHLLLGEASKAIAECERASALEPSDWFPHSFLAAAYANAGDIPNAKVALRSVLKVVPGYTVAQLRAKRYSDHPEYQRLAEEYWRASSPRSPS
jgi:adenylate cyclase